MSQPPYGPPPQTPGNHGHPQYVQPAYAPGQAPPPPPGGWSPNQPPYPPQGQPPYPPHGGAAMPPTPLYKRPWVLVLAGIVVVGAIGSALGGDPEEASTAAAVTTTVTSTVPAEPEVETPAVVAPAPETVAPPTATTPAAPVVDFLMPDVVGMDLQSAQNLMQTNGVWFSVSHDLLGSRNQMVDSNWVVCDQSIPAGQQVTGDVEGQIDFGVVKREEVCP
ncbi:PASTA domain-containing protein [Blastococcus sp. SYSU DS0828]